MIPRYSRPAMAWIWSDEARFTLWLEVEVVALEAMAELGLVPAEAARAVRVGAEAKRDAIVDPKRILEIEAETRHDVIAFLTHAEAVLGPEARFLHQGMTSSDLLDTAFALQLRAAIDLLLEDVDRILKALERRAREHAHTVCIGRSHGVHAEPTTFGLKLAGHFAEFARDRERLEGARAEISTCAISGAVGTFANVPPAVEQRVSERLGLRPEPVSTQVIPRDRHAVVFTTLAIVGGAVERLAIEIRHLMRTEVGEVAEAFGRGQKGSSAMPHKRNPILAENLTGLVRLIRGAVGPALENMALWHERDISHSSVERVLAPDVTIALDFALARLEGVIAGLEIDAERMRRNLDQTQGLVFSQRVLLALTEAGLGRQDAYALVQRRALQAYENQLPLLELLQRDPEITAWLDGDALSNLFDLDYHKRHVDTVFRRVFGP